jgi:DNA-binding NtrC family response regulator
MTHRALVVDDDRLMVKTLSEILALQGWSVTAAHDGKGAVDAVRAEPFDVVLMDIKMPGLDGVSAFKAMKSTRPDVKVVLMTAYAAQETIAEAEDEGVLRVMSKPVDIRSLLAFLAGALSARRPVLLVDNDHDFLKTLNEVLKLRGFETIVAENLEQASRLLRERHPAAILLHMHLGTQSARDAVIAVHEMNPEVALILYSGQPGAAEEINGAVPREYVHSFLQKPFAVDQVTGVLSEVVGD